MSKKDCKIVQDLLPNYIDNLTTKETNEFIEKHISECEECKNVLENMRNDLKTDDTKKEKKIINFIKKYNKKMRILKFILLAIIIIYVAILGRKTIIMLNLANKANEYKDKSEYWLRYSVSDESILYRISLDTKNGKYLRHFEFASINYEKNSRKTVDEYNDSSELSNYYIEDYDGEKTAVLNYDKDGVLPLEIKDFCFEMPQSKLALTKNIFKSSITKSGNVYFIKDIELENFGFCDVYINKSTGLINRIILRQPQYLGNPIIGQATINVSYGLSNFINEETLEEPDITEYKIVEQ